MDEREWRASTPLVWKIFGEGPAPSAQPMTAFNEEKQDLTAEDVRFTTKGNTLYAFVMQVG